MVLAPQHPAVALRVSDADRERVAESLRESCGEGRLRLDELEERLDRAYAARTASELAPLVGDLPGGRAALPGRSRSARRRRPLARLAWIVGLAVALVGFLAAAVAAPLETGLIVAVLAVLAVLTLQAIVAAVPTLVVAGVVWAVVRAMRRRPGLGSAFPR